MANKKLYIGTSYLGDEPIVTTRFHSDNEKEMEWLRQFISDAQNNHHPAFSYRVDVYEYLYTETHIPRNPLTLKELGIDV